MASFAERLDMALRETCGLGRTDRLAVAVSGGVDSVVLLRSLAEADWSVIAIHIHHGLRASADEDAEFVRKVGAEVGVEVEVVRVEVGVGNVQARAREARYDALAWTARKHRCTAVATAHTATDQAETVLMNLVRGAGLRGLGGMAPRRLLDGEGEVVLVRPMLWASRAEVESEARARGWRWIEDPTNASKRYRRNRIRAEVLPLLEAEGGSDTAGRIARAADAARAALAGPAPLAVLVEHGHSDGDGGRIDLGAVRPLPRDVRLAVWAEALRQWAPGAPRSIDIAERVDALLDAPVGQRVEVGEATVWRERIDLVVTRTPSRVDAISVSAESGDWSIQINGGELESQVVDEVPSVLGLPWNEEVVDADRVPAALTVRPWRDGDRLQPLGMDGQKLVSDLLTDRRIPPSQRRSVLVVCGEGEVLWVVGHRLAARVALTDQTTRAARWRWTPVAAPEGGG